MRVHKKRRAISAALVTATAAIALVPSGALAALTPSDFYGGQYSDCFWNIGVINGKSANIAYPDAGANYWGAIYTVPAGAKLELEGQYPHTRYASLQAYNALGQVTDALADFQINPDKGSKNPFRPGVRRDVKKRAFTIEAADRSPAGAIRPDPRSNEPARNVISTKPIGDTSGLHYLVWRDYLPDRGTDLRGDVKLPQPKLTLADGSVQTGAAACKTLTSEEPRLPDPSSLLVSKDVYDPIRYQPGVPAFCPAIKKLEWRVQYNRAYLLSLWSKEKVDVPPKGGTGGFFPNLHNQYVRAALNRKLGKVVALRGTLATTPATMSGQKRIKQTQLRYQSFCMNESVLTTKVMDCTFDEEIPLDGKRRYTVVTSRKADRPKNATKKCGVAWVEWKSSGDGGRDKDFGWMQIRTMLPAPSFNHAVQDTKSPGDEKKVMGKYLPTGKYYSGKRAFEKLGCATR